MAFYSDDVIEEIRSRNDVVDVISQYVHLQKKGTTYFGLCPFHNEKTSSFSVTPSKQMYYCFGCHKGGNVINFVMDYENFTFPEALKVLADRVGLELPETDMSAEDKKKASKKAQMYELYKEAATYFYKLLKSPSGQVAHEYFLKRGLTEETINKFGLGYSDKYSNDLYKHLRQKGYSDELLKESGLCKIDEKKGGYDYFWNRPMFPIMDINNKVIAFGGRAIGDAEPKYLNSPETMIFNKSRNLFGMNIARKTRRNMFILCEGYMDVISLHQAGFDNAVASLGTALTEGHATVLKRFGKDVYLSYDSDGAGQNAALRAIPILSKVGITCKVINMSPYKDPDEFINALGCEEYEKRIENAENAFMFRVRKCVENFDMSDPGEKATCFSKRIPEMLLEFEEAGARDAYISTIANTYGIKLESLQQDVVRLAAKGYVPKALVDEPVRELPLGLEKKANKTDGVRACERLLLTWLVDRPDVYNRVKNYVAPEHFEDGVYREVATEVFAAYTNGEAVEPAKILNKYMDDSEKTAEVAKIFNAIAEDSNEETIGQYLKDVVVKIRERALMELKSNIGTTDGGFQKLKEEKLFLESLKKKGNL